MRNENRSVRKRVYEIIEVAETGDFWSTFYDIFMMTTISISLVPLVTKSNAAVFQWIELVTTLLFVIDYGLRFWTADLKLKRATRSFLLYPITPMAVIDLVSILPSLSFVGNGFRLFKILRLLRTLRAARVFKFFRYSQSIQMIENVFRKQKESLLAVCGLVVAYILISALIIFSVEQDTFESFFEAIYWSTISLTTIGYGDICAVSILGKIITMISSIFGIAVVALPAGILTAGYVHELEEKQREDAHDKEARKNEKERQIP